MRRTISEWLAKIRLYGLYGINAVCNYFEGCMNTMCKYCPTCPSASERLAAIITAIVLASVGLFSMVLVARENVIWASPCKMVQMCSTDTMVKFVFRWICGLLVLPGILAGCILIMLFITECIPLCCCPYERKKAIQDAESDVHDRVSHEV
jgi:hypothetical protein